MKKLFFFLILLLCPFVACGATAREEIFESPLPTPVRWAFSCGFPEAKKALVRRGVEFWNRELGRTILVEKEQCGTLDISTTIAFHYSSRRAVSLTDGTVLAATLRRSIFGLITWCTVTTYLDWQKEPSAIQEEVIRHEIGHALGFNHMRSTRCLMYSFVGDGTKGLCPAERKLLRKAYD